MKILKWIYLLQNFIILLAFLSAVIYADKFKMMVSEYKILEFLTEARNLAKDKIVFIYHNYNSRNCFKFLLEMVKQYIDGAIDLFIEVISMLMTDNQSKVVKLVIILCKISILLRGILILNKYLLSGYALNRLLITTYIYFNLWFRHRLRYWRNINIKFGFLICFFIYFIFTSLLIKYIMKLIGYI